MSSIARRILEDVAAAVAQINTDAGYMHTLQRVFRRQQRGAPKQANVPCAVVSWIRDSKELATTSSRGGEWGRSRCKLEIAVDVWVQPVSQEIDPEQEEDDLADWCADVVRAVMADPGRGTLAFGTTITAAEPWLSQTGKYSGATVFATVTYEHDEENPSNQ